VTVLDGIIGSDNPFPSVLFVEGTTPATPATGRQRLFVDTADGLLKLVDDAGVVTSIGGSAAAHIADTSAAHAASSIGFTPNGSISATDVQAAIVEVRDEAGTSAGVAADAIWDAAGDLIQGTGANTAARLALGTAGLLLRVNAAATAVEWGGLLGTVESYLSADVTMVNANSFYSHSSLAVTPVAGTYLVLARLAFTSVSSANPRNFVAKLSTGGSISSDVLTGDTGVASSPIVAASGNGGHGPTAVVFALVTVDGSTAIRASLNCEAGSSNGILRTTGVETGVVTNKASNIIALRIA
jgi:hypothetical protein